MTYDNLSRGWRDMMRWGPLVEGDLLDRERLDAAVAQAKPDMVAHFAAQTYVAADGDPPVLVASNAKAGTAPGREPVRSDIRPVVADAFAWAQDPRSAAAAATNRPEGAKG